MQPNAWSAEECAHSQIGLQLSLSLRQVHILDIFKKPAFFLETFNASALIPAIL
jgi:hypothetical protein